MTDQEITLGLLLDGKIKLAESGVVDPICRVDREYIAQLFKDQQFVIAFIMKALSELEEGEIFLELFGIRFCYTSDLHTTGWAKENKEQKDGTDRTIIRAAN